MSYARPALVGAPSPRCPHCHGDLATQARPLTLRQSAVYRFVLGYRREQGYAPSLENIAAHFAYNSLATVHEHLSNLETKGWIRRAYNEARAIECLVEIDAA